MPNGIILGNAFMNSKYQGSESFIDIVYLFLHGINLTDRVHA